MADYYQILEITPDASPEAIKEQYRFLVQAWHPDKFPNPAQKLKAEEKIKEINAAYEILRNPAKRAEYDINTNYARPSQKQGYHEQTAQYESEEERRRKEEAARYAEDIRRQKISQLDQEISAINQEINKLNKKMPEMPNAILATLFFIGGVVIPFFSSSENIDLLLLIGGASVVFGIVLFRERNEFYKNSYKPKLDEIEKKREHLKQLIREKKKLK